VARQLGGEDVTLSIHLLESDRALVMVKAAQPITKLHSLDMAGEERADGQATSGLWERLQASGEKFVAWMQMERARFAAVFAHANIHKRAATILNTREGLIKSQICASNLYRSRSFAKKALSPTI
jgi:hypothetical protein